MDGAFITGSHAYGKPRPDSDIDVIVPITQKEAIQISNMFSESVIGYDNLSINLRFKKLDLILVFNEQFFNLWKSGTEDLKLRKPVTRDDACNHFRSIFNQLMEVR